MTTPADQPDPASILDDIRFWTQVTQDARRTLLCPPGLADKARAMFELFGIDALYEVVESSTVPAGQVIVVDHNAIDAATRQAIQSVSNGFR